MINQLLRPKVAFLTGLGLLVVGQIFSTFVIGGLYWAAQSIGFNLAAQFASGLVGGVDVIMRIAIVIGPALIVGSLIMLKIERVAAEKPGA